MQVGIDLVKIRRAEKILESTEELQIILTDDEIAHITGPERLAGNIALKEAFFKANQKKLDWHSVEVRYTDNGAPYLLSTAGRHTSVSISHDGEYAIAVVIIV